MRSRFDQQLTQLSEMLVQTGELCEQAISQTMVALSSSSDEIAREVIRADAHIDQMERDIEHLCLKLLLQQQPVAGDLRQVSAALKMITDMERIGDQAADIAEIVKSTDMSLVRGFPKIPQMAAKTAAMVHDAVQSFVDRDLALATATQAADDAVDRMFAEVATEMIDFIVHADAADAQKAIDVIMIAKYLERIGDHATNLAEWVDFSITGVHDVSFDTKSA
ncbi:phosphate signaling complex protein PhoU [Mobiluncus curtisii]|uniref:Phosphate-specific transport system accessory protein PhoU n=3 Tax=Mobiluncus curtisii TaxID=2051 RepID=D6ZGD2_MOBCV|nr:phosphate signaling complex protein PhoU [Mobiluncus curtisii]ADI67690.1 phosphate transport system regulatory protein PhoU [Mobiluncus curtisii ATCC 43063]EFL94179.1 phosphate transport system regulatory protein PhoU [Mobiluncus curtisii subsp. curtisii ATCC 35241]MCV0000852.1 phosphate signaling complex protein PhoU [Mobiluncus curtisii]NMW46137.1 phosphate signaling complex protein PhoU [Mobiluncus curtisii]NMX13319.1 phosphate signaling complex protein PhoU [Mobiluncus curtisii]